jgi:glucosamine--fructose-6-phosphate aminotransferase (isomerizing)
MCGIIGYVGQREAVPILLEGLQKLEYRGYDSAGIAVLSGGKLELRRSEGKLTNLISLLAGKPLPAQTGLGHTRWATHGRPSEDNAHPHCNQACTLAVVHNGIVENDRDLHKQLEAEGFKFTSDTDSEVFAHLIDKYYRDGATLEQAVQKAVALVRGTFALGVVSQSEPGKLVAARRGSPLIVGLGDHEFFLASDVPAFLTYTRRVLYMENNELAVITREGVRILDIQGREQNRAPETILWDALQAEKGGYKHFMLKEIYEQPQVMEDTLRGRVLGLGGEVTLEDAGLTDEMVRGISRIFLVACGTSWHAGLVGKFLLERLAGIPTEVDFASEFRYRAPLVGRDALVVLISQSGETADTLAALAEAKARGGRTLAICNVLGSSMTREAHGTLYTHAGPEIGVASTKAFTAQLTALHLLALFLGRGRGILSADAAMTHMDELRQIPALLERVLETDAQIQELSVRVFQFRDFLYLGRGINYPIALEGALKLKEISYIHAEGYPAGEMKHGPIALIDGRMPVVAIATASPILEKVLSNIAEVKTRDGSVLALINPGQDEIRKKVDWAIEVPEVAEVFSPLINVVPLQLLAYHVAVKRGCDVDQPRNLAKSVTVE